MFLSKKVNLKKGSNKLRVKVKKIKDNTKKFKLPLSKKIKWELEFIKRLIKWRMT